MSNRNRPLLALVAFISILLIAGCATKRYGRVQPISSFEGIEYTCREIAIEIHKVEAFEDQIREGSKLDGRSVLGFLGDFGIGNAIERSEAEESARVRREDLSRLSAAKGCNEPIAASTSSGRR